MARNRWCEIVPKIEVKKTASSGTKSYRKRARQRHWYEIVPKTDPNSSDLWYEIVPETSKTATLLRNHTRHSQQQRPLVRSRTRNRTGNSQKQRPLIRNRTGNKQNSDILVRIRTRHNIHQPRPLVRCRRLIHRSPS